MADTDAMKLAAAEASAALVEDGMIVGLGSGSTAALVVAALGRRVAQGLRITAIPTSGNTARLAESMHIPLSTLDEHDHIDLTIDGADEVERSTLDLVKGRGGALLREKIVAGASARLVIVIDDSKLVDRLCSGSQPIPVEVEPFGWRTAASRLRSVGADWKLRPATENRPFITDGGHFILDCVFPPVHSSRALAQRIDQMVGVVEHGLFLGMTHQVIVGRAGGVETIRPPASPGPPAR